MCWTIFPDKARSPICNGSRQLGPCEFVHGDVRNAGDVAEVVRRPDIRVIFHLAGQVAMTTSLQNPHKDFQINVCGTLHVLEAARAGNRRGHDRLCFEQ